MAETNKNCIRVLVAMVMLSHVACSSDDNTINTGASIEVSASGEAFGQFGFAYANAISSDEPSFVDGWEVKFDRYLLNIDRVTVNVQGSDPTRRDIVGQVVAEQVGPWLVDLQKPGSLVGAGGAPETAIALLTITQTIGGDGLDVSKQYAFSFATGSATAESKQVNVAAFDTTVAEQMVTKGWTHFVSGTATYKGRTATAQVDAAFVNFPTVVRFEFGFAAPADYINCHNPELGDDEENAANWGLRPKANTAVRAQLTFHTDHMFWDQTDVEGTPLRFDALAARVKTLASGQQSVSMEDLAGVNPLALRDRNTQSVTDRGAQTTGYAAGPGAPPAYQINSAVGISDLRDFIAYNTRAQGHLNADGLCFVKPRGEFGY